MVDSSIRAGRDSVQCITLTAMAAKSEPSILDSPVVVTTHDVMMAERRLVETETRHASVDRRAPSTTMESRTEEAAMLEVARSLAARMELPDVARREAQMESSVPPPSANTSPQVPRTQPPRPKLNSVAAIAHTAELGATVRQPTKAAKITPPVFTSARPPVFPTEARQHGWRGSVVLMLTVAVDGRVTQVEVVESSGYATLDAAAVRAVRTWRGRPATRDGVPYQSKWKKPIRFE